MIRTLARLRNGYGLVASVDAPTSTTPAALRLYSATFWGVPGIRPAPGGGTSDDPS